jgi:DNA-binding NarL/FixJ family response regulator
MPFSTDGAQKRAEGEMIKTPGTLTRTLIVDDSDAFRRCIQAFLESESEIEVIGEATSGMEAIVKARELQPDLVLIDMRMPGMDGISTARQLRQEMPELKIIVMTAVDIQEYRDAVITSGANGFVVKESVVETLLPTIRDVC